MVKFNVSVVPAPSVSTVDLVGSWAWSMISGITIQRDFCTGPKTTLDRYSSARNGSRAALPMPPCSRVGSRPRPSTRSGARPRRTRHSQPAGSRRRSRPCSGGASRRCRRGGRGRPSGRDRWEKSRWIVLSLRLPPPRAVHLHININNLPFYDYANPVAARELLFKKLAIGNSGSAFG